MKEYIVTYKIGGEEFYHYITANSKDDALSRTCMQISIQASDVVSVI